MQVSLIFIIFDRFLKIVICLKLAQNHVFKRVWDDLEAEIGISIKKRLLGHGVKYFFDGFEFFGIFTSMCLFLGF